jgi:hypothetical protein
MPEPKKEWNPAEPLEDEEMEKEAVERAKQRARTKFLEEDLLSKAKKPKEKSKGWLD